MGIDKWYAAFNKIYREIRDEQLAKKEQRKVEYYEHELEDKLLKIAEQAEVEKQLGRPEESYEG